MTDINISLFFIGLLLFLSVLASSLARFGPPLLIQGTSLGWLARLLKLQMPREPEPEASFAFEGTQPDPHMLLAFRIQPASHLAATTGYAIGPWKAMSSTWALSS